LLRNCAAWRILALDHGTKRIGVAVSDELKMIAQPLEYISRSRSRRPGAAQKNSRREEVDLILIGHPRNMDGSYVPPRKKWRRSSPC